MPPPTRTTFPPPKIQRVLMANHPKTVSQALLFVEILSLLPTKRWMSLAEIRAALVLKGVFVSKLTLQRAMKTLREAEDFGIECDQRARPFGYRLRARPAFADFGRIALRPDAALLLKLVDNYLRGLLPGHILSALEPHFGAANRCLAADNPACRLSATWLRKTALAPFNFSFSSSLIAPWIFRTVSEALYCGHKLEIVFEQTFLSTETLIVSPLGLVHGEFPYLVCRPGIGEDLRRIELIQIRDAHILDIPVSGDEDFSVHAYLRSVVGGGASHTTS